jgi:hypothetical protein
MFVYCLNDPVNRIDTSGTVSLWYYLIVDHDMGFIHRAVQLHIKQNNNAQTEVKLSGFGRADVVQFGAVWEIKHAGKNPELRTAIAQAQAAGYVFLNDELTQLGKAGMFSGTFYIQCLEYSYMVECWTPEPGAILYSVTEVYNYSGEYLVEYIFETQEQRSTLHTPALIPDLSPSPNYTNCGITAGVAMFGGLFVCAFFSDLDLMYGFG